MCYIQEQPRERIYKELPKKGINFPYPQMDIHVKQN